jgi:hypothetical protein
MVTNMSNEIQEIILSFNQLPYLFVGTGVSIRYGSAPSWDNLLYNIYKEIFTGNRASYNKLKNKIEYELQAVLSEVLEEDKKYYVNPKIASLLQKKFITRFYDDDKFERIVFTEDESEEIISSNIDPFKFYVAKQLKDIHIDPSKTEFCELTSLTKHQNKVAGVITTNYDTILQHLFTDFSPLIGQDNLLLSNTNNIFELYKIHGSVERPNSLVITHEDYNYFNSKLKYLSAKLLTIFVEHPIIFIVYGMGDVNILNLFYEIAECLTPEELERTKRNFIFITPAFDNPQDIQIKEHHFNGKSICMTEIILDDFSILYENLSNIKSSMPIKLMRKLQDMICNFITSTDVQKNIFVGSINDKSIQDEELGIYFGSKSAISEIGFDSFDIMDIMEDIIYDNKPYLIDDKIITKTFRNIRKSAGTTILPVHKYLSKLGLTIKDIPDDFNILTAIDSITLNKTENRYTKCSQVYKTIEEICNDFPDHLPRQFAHIIKYRSNIETEELGDFLRDFYSDTLRKTKYLSALKKLIAIYDLKKYSTT